MARTRGMEIATTSPALRPRLRKLTTSTIAIASKRASVKPPIASRTTSGWSETSLSSMPTGSRCIRRSAASCRPSPKVRLLPPARMLTPMPIAGLPLTRNILVAGSL